MNIIVVGTGKIGTSIISSLVNEGHDVTAIDNNPQVLEEVSNAHDVMVVCGNGVDCETLEEANISKADLFVAITYSDELNMLSCFLARKMGAKNTIARIRNPEYNYSSLGFLKQELDLSLTINPELLVAQEISNILKFPSAVKVESFSRRNFEMVEIKIQDDSKLDGLTLIKMRELYKANYIICYVHRDDEVYIPDGNFQLKNGDKIGITATVQEIQKLLKMVGVLKKKAKDVMILGGGKTSYYLAKILEHVGASVKIIEKDQKRCYELSSELPNTVMINGDGAHQDLLLEEGIENTDAFVALTGMDEENILISLFAIMHKVPTVISKINREELTTLAKGIGQDMFISPMEITSNILVRYARALENSQGSNVETLYKLMDGKAEALEFNTTEGLPFFNIPLKDLTFKSNTIIAGIIRGRKIIIPSGSDAIVPKDKVIVITAGQRFNDLSDIIK